MAPVFPGTLGIILTPPSGYGADCMISISPWCEIVWALGLCPTFVFVFTEGCWVDPHYLAQTAQYKAFVN